MIKKLAGNIIHQDQWMTIHLDDIELPNGVQSKYCYIAPIPGSFMMVQNEKGEWLVSHEWRYPIHGWTWCWPAGGKEEDETFLEAAKRELAEETGYVAQEWIDLGNNQTDPGKSTHEIHFFVAKKASLEAQIQRDPGEYMEMYWLSEEEITKRIKAGEINNGWLLMGWGLLAAHGYLKS